jgi:hypothetical protein
MRRIIRINTLSFLQSHIDYNKATTPIHMRILQLWYILLCNQLPKIWATMHGGNILETAWMTNHIEQANLHWMNECFIFSSWWQKQHFVLHYQLCFTRLYLVRITARQRYKIKILILRGILFSKLVYYENGPMLCTWSPLKNTIIM